MNDPFSIRPHVSFPTRDLGKARQFYEALFGVPPVKDKGDYVKFSVEQPSLNFSLTQTSKAVERTRSHYGIEVGDAQEVARWHERVLAAGLDARELQTPSCCYAEQTKFWVEDPDGRAWEIFSVHGDTEEFGERTRGEAESAEQATSRERSCCAADCCT